MSQRRENPENGSPPQNKKDHSLSLRKHQFGQLGDKALAEGEGGVMMAGSILTEPSEEIATICRPKLNSLLPIMCGRNIKKKKRKGGVHPVLPVVEGPHLADRGSTKSIQ